MFGTQLSRNSSLLMEFEDPHSEQKFPMLDQRLLSSGIFFTAVTMKGVVLWDITPSGSSKESRRF
jgi:hypothetical protein